MHGFWIYTTVLIILVALTLLMALTALKKHKELAISNKELVDLHKK